MPAGFKVSAGLNDRNREIAKECVALIDAAPISDEQKAEAFGHYQDVLEQSDSIIVARDALKAKLREMAGEPAEPVDMEKAFYETLSHDTGLPVDEIRKRLKGKTPGFQANPET